MCDAGETDLQCYNGQDGMHMGCRTEQTNLPATPSGTFPSPADYAALLHPNPAHTSQVVAISC